jgi:hypothetical protein
MLAIAMCDGRTSKAQRIGSSPNASSSPAMGPWYWLKICAKITATATGATMYGNRMLMRQKVLPRSAWSSRAARPVAITSWGMADSRKMLIVLRNAFQKNGSFSTEM